MIDEPFTADTYLEFIENNFFRYTPGQKDGDVKSVIVCDNASQH